MQEKRKYSKNRQSYLDKDDDSNIEKTMFRKKLTSINRQNIRNLILYIKKEGQQKISKQQATSHFHSQIQINYRQHQVKIIYPHFDGVTLREFIRSNNNRYILSSAKLHTLLFPLLTNLFRIEQRSLSIPTFESVLFSEERNQIYINLFSFAGLDILLHEQKVESQQLIETLAFFSSDHFVSHKRYPNIRRALAVLLLGLIVGKSINLHQIQSGQVSLERIKQFVSTNKQKCQTILQSSNVIKNIKTTEKQSYKLKLKEFLTQMLVKEQDMSWGEIIEKVLIPKNQNYTVIMEQGQQKWAINLEQYIMLIATAKFESMSQQQQQSYINNRIVSMENMKLGQKDAEMLLISEYHIDFQLLQQHRGSLASWLFSLQNTEINQFTQETISIKNQFMKDISDQQLIQKFKTKNSILSLSSQTFAQQKLFQGKSHQIVKKKEKQQKNNHADKLQYIQINEKNIFSITCFIFKETDIHKFKTKDIEREKRMKVLSEKQKTLMQYSSFMTP